jgi:hypothetical protein
MTRLTAAERHAKFQAELDILLTEATQHPSEWDVRLDGFPWTVRASYHDGPGAMFYGQDGKPRLQFLIREPDVAVELLRAINQAAAR